MNKPNCIAWAGIRTVAPFNEPYPWLAAPQKRPSLPLPKHAPTAFPCPLVLVGASYFPENKPRDQKGCGKSVRQPEPAGRLDDSDAQPTLRFSADSFPRLAVTS